MKILVLNVISVIKEHELIHRDFVEMYTQYESILMKKTLIITGIVVVVSILFLVLFVSLTSGKDKNLNFAEAKEGYFEITISSTGELIAENSVDIKGPDIVRNRNFRATPLKIIDLVPEGTTVKKGDFVATLDRSSFNNSLKDEQEELRKNQNELESKTLDTAVVLSTLRDEIKNQYYVAEEAKITLAQSKFEPPATQRQAEISLDKAQRTYTQKQKTYQLKKAQTRAELRNLAIQVSTQQRKVNDLDSVLKAFVITAPGDGMVIYKKDQSGKKIITGTILNPWDPVVATLPDLSSMLSKVFISEIDINKVVTGQKVEITIDAFPDKFFNGNVSGIANIGEQLSNSDSKVFEVLVKLADYDPLLRPSMTTSNRLIVHTFSNVIYVPNESVHAGIDSIPFVYTRDGVKQVVVLGEANDKNIIIEKGLEAGKEVWLTIPEKAEKFSIAGTELIPIIKERAIAKLESGSYKNRKDDFSVLTDDGGSAASGSTGND